MPEAETRRQTTNDPHLGHKSVDPLRSPQAPQEEPSYYDISFLKPPVWKWEIASYFFLGGVSSGAYLLARMAEIVGGGREYHELIQAGTYIAAAAAVPCAPLLIHDLGDPKRFHHMLRVFKPTTPMNLGTWVMTSYVGSAFVAALREWMIEHGTSHERSALAKIRDGALIVVADAAGVPLAILLAGYTGVLLSCTSNPLWTKNPWLGPLFSASSIAAGAAAVSLAMDLMGVPPESPSKRALSKVDTIANLTEIGMLAGYLKHAGPFAKPLTHGSQAKHTWGSIGAVVVAEALKAMPRRRGGGKWASIAASLLGLAGSYSLRWAFVYGGHESAQDPKAARLATGTKSASSTPSLGRNDLGPAR